MMTNITASFLEKRYRALQTEFAASGEEPVGRALDKARDDLLHFLEGVVAEQTREIAQLNKRRD